MDKPKIFLSCYPMMASGFKDVRGTALAEDGTYLAQHISSNEEWSKHDLGLTSTRKHDIYKAYYPDGFDLVWVDNVYASEAWQAAFVLNKQQREG